MPTPPVIVTRGLTRVFRRTEGDLRAVDDVDLEVTPGEFLGLLGLNGAGKSTAVKLLTGVLVPTAGSARVCGLEPAAQRRRLARRIGVVFGQRSALWWDLPLADSFTLVHRLYRTTPAHHRARLDELVDLLDLGPQLRQPVRSLSLGQRMRGELVAAMLHDPEVLFLDEPTIGLDVVSRARLRDVLRDLNARRATTIVLTTHDLPDVEALCRRVVVLDHGRLAHDGTLEGLHRLGRSTRILSVDLTEARPALTFPGLPGVHVVEVTDRVQRISLPLEQPAAPVIAAVVAQAGLRDLALQDPTLEGVMHALHGAGSTPAGSTPDRD
ncbi:ATP-binding cassette domain-containing protein [Nocardioides sp.]|uniref:ATP-binding cassette domain-containing protein n=1 Tax=Nocardioides sp. TaxID=35761 RepID=UPI003515AB60